MFLKNFYREFLYFLKQQTLLFSQESGFVSFSHVIQMETQTFHNILKDIKT